eukprot:TRINITY_DN6569_c0_g1_i1.p1 TRINITY_DN6569_c0_g1~~TRINITY_DN6569_c0_g1_i1.p1  ORF type:complete len:566 (-),score=181.29 TRINITY_DN6569_c0_g1_i1:252-1841(-)
MQDDNMNIFQNNGMDMMNMNMNNPNTFFPTYPLPSNWGNLMKDIKLKNQSEQEFPQHNFFIPTFPPKWNELMTEINFSKPLPPQPPQSPLFNLNSNQNQQEIYFQQQLMQQWESMQKLQQLNIQKQMGNMNPNHTSTEQLNQNNEDKSNQWKIPPVQFPYVPFWTGAPLPFSPHLYPQHVIPPSKIGDQTPNINNLKPNRPRKNSLTKKVSTKNELLNEIEKLKQQLNEKRQMSELLRKKLQENVIELQDLRNQGIVRGVIGDNTPNLLLNQNLLNIQQNMHLQNMQFQQMQNQQNIQQNMKQNQQNMQQNPKLDQINLNQQNMHQNNQPNQPNQPNLHQQQSNIQQNMQRQNIQQPNLNQQNNQQQNIQHNNMFRENMQQHSNMKRKSPQRDPQQNSQLDMKSKNSFNFNSNPRNNSQNTNINPNLNTPNNNNNFNFNNNLNINSNNLINNPNNNVNSTLNSNPFFFGNSNYPLNQQQLINNNNRVLQLDNERLLESPSEETKGAFGSKINFDKVKSNLKKTNSNFSM